MKVPLLTAVASFIFLSQTYSQDNYTTVDSIRAARAADSAAREAAHPTSKMFRPEWWIIGLDNDKSRYFINTKYFSVDTIYGEEVMSTWVKTENRSITYKGKKYLNTYEVCKYRFKCNKGLIAVGNSVTYLSTGKILFQQNGWETVFEEVIPNTVGEWLLDEVKKYAKYQKSTL